MTPSDVALFEEPRVHRVLAPDGECVGPLPAVDDDTLRRMLEIMLLVRHLDERMMILQRQGRIGFYGACTGQEASPVGTAAALEPRDWIFPGLREGGAMLYRGFSLETYICQVLGNDGDILRGRQMPSHQAGREVNQVSWGSCIGTQISQAMGAAWAARMRRDDIVTVAFMGDGATSVPDFHYGLNFAGVFRAPSVFLCQNNQWSISLPTEKQTNARTIAEKAVAYGLPYARVDGNDVLAVYGAVKEAVDRARAGEGASFLELLTYRIGAHSSSDDPRVYRDEREVEDWKKRDPIDRYQKFLVRTDRISQAWIEQKVEAIEGEIQAAVTRAESRPAPPLGTLFDGVYSEPLWHIEQQRKDGLEEDA